MIIAAQKNPEAATESKPAPFDVALVVVHGMGSAYKSEMLLEWAEPILERMDWLARDKVIGADESHGVVIHDSDLSGDVPVVTATVRFPKRPAADAADTPAVGRVGGERRAATVESEVGTAERKVAILEARWSESFVPMTRAQVFQWAVRFLWRAIRRALGLFSATLVLLPWFRLVHHLDRPLPWKFWRFVGRISARTALLAADLVRLVLSTLAFVVTWLFVVLVGGVLTLILPFLSPLLLFPWFKNVAQGVLDAIIGSIGDVAAWRERPVRASAMRLVVRDALERAKDLVGEGDVHVLAHSQGAAVATYALFEELDPSAFNVRRLTTVGAAVVLLGREKWRGRKDTYNPVTSWITKNTPTGDPVTDTPAPRVAWSNHWAIWDPFSAGPIADTRKERRERWHAAYFPSRVTTALGPEEHAVYNTSQPFLDHGMYSANTAQVVEPTVRHLLGPDFPELLPEVDYIRDRLTVIDKKGLGFSLVAALVIAAILPGLPWAGAAFAWLVNGVVFVIGSTISFLVPGPASAPFDDASFLLNESGGGPSVIGWVVASVLLAALLIWLYQLMQMRIERSLIWNRCPLNARTWLVLTAIPRTAYALGAAAVVVCAIWVWNDPPLDPRSLTWSAIGLGIAAIFVSLEPLLAPAPVIVPERESLTTSLSARPAPEPMRLRAAIDSKVYREDRDLRRKLLEPKGRWAELKARVLHKWRPMTTASEVGAAKSGG